ncbi:hypothetical protein [uncultured Shewanella sp.]|uniref:hypothetical protein n=1 Tax=uncultured Shewanella sp. TaxID=173975 RepID=UPI0026252408|nr:hypothetical protein [uncultured Shewanella sp.]
MEQLAALESFQRLLNNRSLYEIEDQKTVLQTHIELKRELSLNALTPSTKVNEYSLFQMKQIAKLSAKINKQTQICITKTSTELSVKVRQSLKEMKESLLLGNSHDYLLAKNTLLQQLQALKSIQCNDINLLVSLRPVTADVKMGNKPTCYIQDDYLETLSHSLPQEKTLNVPPQKNKSLTLFQLHESILSLDPQTNKEDIEQLSQDYQNHMLTVQVQLLKFNKTKQLFSDLLQYSELTEVLLGSTAFKYLLMKFTPVLLTIDRSITNNINMLANSGFINITDNQKQVLEKIENFYQQ